MFCRSTNLEAHRDVESGRDPGARAGKVKILEKKTPTNLQSATLESYCHLSNMRFKDPYKTN